MRSIRRRLTTLQTLPVILPALTVATASAHVPDECRPLFLAAGKATEAVTRRGNEANEVAMDGLDRGRRVGIHDYSMLVDGLAQLLGWQADMFTRLMEATALAQSGSR